MMMRALKTAFIISLIAFFISLPILGVSIEQTRHGLTLKGEWWHSVYGALAVFLVQFLLTLSPWRFVSAPMQKLALCKVAVSWSSFENKRHFLLAILIVFACVLPFFASRAGIDLGTQVLIYVMLALGLNVTVGYAGLLDLGYVSFYAIGAYTYAILQQYGWGFWSSLPLAAFFAMLMALLLGFPVLRLRGDYLAIVTLGFSEILRTLLNNLSFITNGPSGISSIKAPSFFHISFERRPEEGMVGFHELFSLRYSSEYRLIFLYFVILIFCLLTFFIISRLQKMPMGRAWEALREDEIACRSLGLNPTSIKLSAFITGAFFAGIAGAFFAAKQGFINPESFTFGESAIILAMVVLGGMGSQLGVILAAVALVALPELARNFSEYRMLIFGAVMVLMMIWRPQGLLPAQRPKMEMLNDNFAKH